MRQNKISGWLASAVVCSLLMAAGCAPRGEEAARPKVEPEKQIPKAIPVPKAIPAKPVTIALKFTPQDSTTYKVTIQTERSVKFEGLSSDKAAFKGGSTGNKIEMTFTQRIQSVDDKGNAIAKIKIKGLKYLAKVKNRPVLNFDSSRKRDQKNPLAKLIGRGYTIEITPTGVVTKVTDVKRAQAAIRGSSPAATAALKLLSPVAIKKCHGTLVLPDTDKNRLRTGDNWSNIRTFDFGLMGSKSYEKIYTLKEIKDTDNRQIAIVEMNAIPSSETAKQLYKEQAMGGISKIFDNTETYTGQLKLDLTAGKVEKYLEKLQSEWVVVQPLAGEESGNEPAALKMSVIRLYRLEKID